MTAPAIAPSTSTPVSPVETQPATTQAVPEVTPVFSRPASEPVGLDAMIAKVASRVVQEPTTTEQTPADQPAEPAQDVPARTEPAAQEIPAAPTGSVTVDDGDVVLTAERNADGTFKTQIDPNQKFDIQMRDPETGELRSYTKTMPEVLRMARDGVWGQKVKDEVTYYRTEVPKWQQTHEQLASEYQQATTQLQSMQEQLQAQMELNRELLTAPDEIVIQRREEYAHEMSPEQRLAKLEASLRDRENTFRLEQERQKHAQQAETFIQTRLMPVLNEAEQSLGGTDYAKKLVMGQVAAFTTPLLVNGQLPPQAWPTIEKYLGGEFKQWVSETAAFFKNQQTTATASTEAVRKAQVEAQRVVNSTGQLLRPVGNAHGVVTAAPQGRPKSANEAIERIINRPLANTG